MKLIACKDVSLFALWCPVESAKVANSGAHVGVVDVAIDIVGPVALRVHPFANHVGCAANFSEPMAFEKLQGFIAMKAITFDRFFQDSFDHETTKR